MNKICPKCDFKDCYHKARECEKCGYNFITKRMPTKKKEPKESPEELKPLPAKVKVKSKECPTCGFKECYGSAIECERCGFRFVKLPEKIADPHENILFEPNWKIFLPLKWLHEYNNDAIEWVAKITSNFKREFGVNLKPNSLIVLAKLSPNKTLLEAIPYLEKEYRNLLEQTGVINYVGIFFGEDNNICRESLQSFLSIGQVKALIKKAQHETSITS